MMLMMLHLLTIGEKMIDKIYIPTFRRPNNQMTFDNLPDEYKEKVVMVVQEQEKDEYKAGITFTVKQLKKIKEGAFKSAESTINLIICLYL